MPIEEQLSDLDWELLFLESNTLTPYEALEQLEELLGHAIVTKPLIVFNQRRLK